MKHNYKQVDLFGQVVPGKPSLPINYKPVRPDHFQVSQIYVAQGSFSTPELRRFAEGICHLYPMAKVAECLDTPHNHIELGALDAPSLHQLGKRTIVFRELKTAQCVSAKK